MFVPYFGKSLCPFLYDFDLLLIYFIYMPTLGKSFYGHYSLFKEKLFCAVITWAFIRKHPLNQKNPLLKSY